MPAEQTVSRIAAWHDLMMPSSRIVHPALRTRCCPERGISRPDARGRWDRQPRPFKPTSPKSICTRPLCHRNPSRTTDAPRRSCAGCPALQRASGALLLALFAVSD